MTIGREPGVAAPWVFFDVWADLVLHDVITRQDILRLLQHSGKRDLEESKHPKSELSDKRRHMPSLLSPACLVSGTTKLKQPRSE